jgi:hypothetical protein
MLFKPVHEYAPDAGCDDAPEAVAAPALSEARTRLAKLLLERTECQSAMQAARDAIARLQAYITAPGQIERDIGELDSFEASLIAAWSSTGGAFPVLDADRRQALEEALSEARNKASGAQRAIPALEAALTRASNAAAAISLDVAAAIGEILLEEVDYQAIVTAKADLAAAIARAEAGRELALIGVESSIPQDRRPTVAAQFYASLATLEKVRAAAMSNPPPSYDGGPWRDLASRLASSANATVEG